MDITTIYSVIILRIWLGLLSWLIGTCTFDELKESFCKEEVVEKLPKYKQYQPLNRTWLKTLYWDLKWTDDQIAEHLSVSASWVFSEIKRHGLVKRDNGIKYRGKKGYKQSEEEKKIRQNQPHAVRVVKLNKDGKEIETYRSIKYAAKANKIKAPSHIRRAINEPHRTCGGYKWKLAS